MAPRGHAQAQGPCVSAELQGGVSVPSPLSQQGCPLPQVACHELCHLLGLGNCRWLRCLMQGALSLDQALRRPLDLCPICLRKLQHILGFRLLDRYKVSGVGRECAGTQQCCGCARGL